MSEYKNPITVSQTTMKRLVSDIKQINKNPLTTQGIYYKHDETDLLKGYAMIVGPSDTPYEYGYYLFEFKFPTTYPFQPPIVISCTQDGNTRFNPNLYVSGKVCVSVLNTWSGEQWSSCQTISSILLILCTLLCNNPFTNEPQMTTEHPDCSRYNKIILYKNIEVAILKMLTKECLPKRFLMFHHMMVELFDKNKDKIINTIVNNLQETNVYYSVSIYNLNVRINYVELLQKITDFTENINNYNDETDKDKENNEN